MSLNLVVIEGHLGRDPELRQTHGGSPVCNFSVATSEKWNDKGGQKQEKTTWHRVTVWGTSADACAKYLAKGSRVLVTGKIDERKWQDKDGNDRTTVEIIARDVQFLDAKRDGGGGGGGGGYDKSPRQGSYDPGPSEDDECPF